MLCFVSTSPERKLEALKQPSAFGGQLFVSTAVSSLSEAYGSSPFG